MMVPLASHRISASAANHLFALYRHLLLPQLRLFLLNQALVHAVLSGALVPQRVQLLQPHHLLHDVPLLLHQVLVHAVQHGGLLTQSHHLLHQMLVHAALHDMPLQPPALLLLL